MEDFGGFKDKSDECHKCGTSGSEVKLYEVIHNEGVVKYCERCAKLDDLPFVRKPSEFKLKEADRSGGTVYDRLSRISGVKLSEEDRRRPLRTKPGISDYEKTDTTLREIVDRNFKSRTPTEKKHRDDLVDNFNWRIMRSRRMRKVSPEALAKAIGESVSAVKAAEAGIVQENDYTLLIKLERVLNVVLIKDRSKIPSQATFGLDPVSKRVLTVGDLKKMKEETDDEFETRVNTAESNREFEPFIDEEEFKEKGEGFFSKFFGLRKSSGLKKEAEEEDYSDDFSSRNYSELPDEDVPLNLIEKDLRHAPKGPAQRKESARRSLNEGTKKKDLTDDEIRRLAFGRK